MKVLILAAGYGTRLYELGEGIPKALLDINGKPLLHYVLEKITVLDGLEEIILVTNDKFFSVFTDWVKKQKGILSKIKVISDGTKVPEDRLGSIGDIDYVLKRYPINDDLLVVGSDNLFDYNLDEFLVSARTKASAISLGLYDIGDLKGATKFGVVELDKNDKIASFEEKPQQPKSSLVAMCFYYMPQASLGLITDYLAECQKSDTAGDYIRWLHEKTDVYGFKFVGKWYDIGSVEAYKEAQERFK